MDRSVRSGVRMYSQDSKDKALGMLRLTGDVEKTARMSVGVNVNFTIFTNVFSPIAPTRIRRIRQRGCAAFGA